MSPADAYIKARQNAVRTVAGLRSSLDEPESEFVQDSIIKRFEFSTEACWKALRAYLRYYAGIEVQSPKPRSAKHWPIV